ncbi:MAG TPA: intein-containing Rv2578c family radical SAM protein [Solirubrobacteraceae bacterium]|nr:intein-containing Rv2578c family radical SAM protein [Solirubrobacteraceae bacterium]
MRWDNLTITAEEQARLPGYREPAVVRHFDAPEALDTRFYEVRAKSALNQVPKQSRMPFRWTINPYRGCSHACVYCTWGETPILMADGRTRRLAELEVGDEIYGTQRRGTYRHYVRTEVLAHWSSVKRAYRITLEDGTELVASADHRFLTGRGWKHVTGAEQGRDRRPHLTVGCELMGTGRFASSPTMSPDYRRGYLCGLIRGDGQLGTYSYKPPGRNRDEHHRFRLALCDDEALERAQQYLLDEGVVTAAFQFQAATATRRAARAVRTSSRANVERVMELIRWPLSPSDDWRKGFLAGIFDAEGTGSGAEALRIANTDPAILDWTAACLRHFGFHALVEPGHGAPGLKHVRLRGGLVEKLRLFHTTEPAISRKRDIEGVAIKSDARLNVVSIEDLGMAMRLYDITTGTGDFIANGVVSHNCFARPTHTYLDFNAGRDFEREIVVKVNVPEVLRVELARPSWKHEHVALGTNTDPYQWVEGRYKLMRGIWEAMRDAANPCSVLTKSPLLLRDLDLMQEIAEVADFSANLSIPTIDEKAWRASEPHTPNPRARLEAVAELNRAGIPTGVLIAPLMPGINDDPRQVHEIVEAAAEAGATGISGIGLHLRGEVRGVFMEWLREYRPDLVEHYEDLYQRSAYLPRHEQERLMALVRRAPSRPPSAFRRDPRRDYGIMEFTRDKPARERPRDRPAERRPERRPAEEQTTLF